jgi:hypothetical protein
MAAIRANVRSGFIEYIGGVWLVAAAVFPFYRLITEMVSEKESRIREAMKMMGLSAPAYWVTLPFLSPLFSFPRLTSWRRPPGSSQGRSSRSALRPSMRH